MFVSEQHTRFSPEVGPNLGANIFYLFEFENILISFFINKLRETKCYSSNFVFEM